jgi:hypothetical protein
MAEVWVTFGLPIGPVPAAARANSNASFIEFAMLFLLLTSIN